MPGQEIAKPEIESSKEKIAANAAAFIRRFYQDRDFGNQMSGTVDVSAPKTEDITLIEGSSPITISRLEFNLENKFVKFYVGGTEFMLTEKAAEYVLNNEQ